MDLLIIFVVFFFGCRFTIGGSSGFVLNLLDMVFRDWDAMAILRVWIEDQLFLEILNLFPVFVVLKHSYPLTCILYLRDGVNIRPESDRKMRVVDHQDVELLQNLLIYFRFPLLESGDDAFS